MKLDRIIAACLVATGSLFLSVSSAHAALGTVCDPTSPLNGVYCLNQSCAANQVGVSTLDKDQQNIIACLNDPASGRTIWKSMSGSSANPLAGSGGSATTFFGLTACPTGWTLAQSGRSVVVRYQSGTEGGTNTGAVSNAFCSSITSTPGINFPSAVLDDVVIAAGGAALPCVVCTK